MYVRFVPLTEIPESEYEWSLFGAIAHASELADVDGYDRSRLEEIETWFRKNLGHPTRLSRSRKPHSLNEAVCWFKSSASECIDWVREAVAILERYEIRLQMLTTHQPGYIIYEDEYQIAAVPFRRTSYNVQH